MLMKFSSLFVPQYYLNLLLMPSIYIKNQLHGWIFDNYFDYYYLEDYRFHIPKDLTTRVYRGAQFIHSNYENDERKLLRYIDPKSTVLELGAGIGILSCIINKHLSDPSKHLAIEANPNLIPILKKNRDLNNMNFLIENTLVSDVNTFYINLKAINASSALKKIGNRTKVSLTKIENLQKKYKLTFDTAIIDIEGAEINFIEEKIQFLDKLKTIMIEFHPGITGKEDIDEAYKTLKQLKFRLIKKSNLVELWEK